MAFSGLMGDASSTWDMLTCLFTGSRFDCRPALLFIAPLFLLSTIFSLNEGLNRRLDAIRLWWGWFCVSLTVLVCVVDVGFFAEYHEQFNQWVLGIVFDDFRSLMLTIWNGYPIVWIVLGFGLVSFLLFFGLKRWLSRPFFDFNFIDSSRFSQLLKIALVLLMIFLMKCSITLTLGFYSLTSKNMAVTGDNFLNGLVVNPYYALYKTVREHKKRSALSGVSTFIPDGDLKSALIKIYPNGPSDSTNIDDWIAHTAKGSPLDKQPEHIFLIVMESQDNWLLQDNYYDIPVSPNLRRLKDEGLYVRSFLSAANSTAVSLDCLLMGIPDVGVISYYQPLTRQPFSSSIAKQFRELGYTPNFFYGGYLAWVKIGDIAANQGFENIYGCPSMGPRSEFHDWGIPDKRLFEFIAEKIKNSTGPTFNVIMTTSNHTPHQIPLEEEGCPLCEIREALEKRECYTDSKAKILGHSWYADNCVGEFVEEVLNFSSNSLFAITGDHFGRYFIYDKMPTFECRSVPFILYGPEVLSGISMPETVAGSHVDIAPTLIELVAPQGYKYHSLGCSLLDPNARGVGIGVRSVMFPDCIFDVQNDNAVVEPLPWSNKVVQNSPKELKDLYNAFHAVGWWMIMRGTEFGENENKVSRN